jgi:hypothetical protein
VTYFSLGGRLNLREEVLVASFPLPSTLCPVAQTLLRGVEVEKRRTSLCLPAATALLLLLLVAATLTVPSIDVYELLRSAAPIREVEASEEAIVVSLAGV